MKLRVPDNIRVFLSKKYLDWAENLPKFGDSFIVGLEAIREHQQDMSESEYKISRPPEGTEIEYLYFRLIEMFHIEEFDKLLKGLVQLFPGLQDDYTRKNRDFLSDFKSFAETISGGGMMKLGSIRREGKGGFNFFRTIGIVKDLPSEVNHIEVRLHKFLPSVLIVSLDVHLSNKATDHLLELQRSHYLPRLRFSSLVPWKTRNGGHSWEPVEAVMAQKILSWIDNLRSDVEKCIRPFLNGYFMQQTSGKKSKLPAIEVYGMKGLPEGEENFETWRKNARGWGESLGFRFYSGSYGDGKALFVWSNNDSTRGYAAYRFVVLWESYLSSIKLDHFSGEKAAVAHYTEYTLDGTILPSIAIIEFLISVRRNIEKLRQNIFGSMKLGSYKLSRNIKLNNVIRRESMLLERISMEFEQQMNLIRYKMNPIEDMKRIKTNLSGNRDKNLKDVMIESVEFNIERLKKHLSFITDSFSEYLEARNMEVMYRLQRSIFWLTIIVTIATIVGLIINWPDIQKFLHRLAQVIRIW